MKYLIPLFFFFFSFSSFASLPPDAQAYLNQIPEKRLTLPYVVKVALLQAQAYKLVGYDYATAELEEWGAVDSLTDTIFTVGGNYSDDNSVKAIGFSPERSKTWDWNLGLSKNWQTGTTTSFQWVQDINNQQFAPLPGGFANNFITDFKQSMAIFNIEQSLLKDAFGYAYRRKRDAAIARGKSIQWKTRNDLEELTLGFVNQYYGAWLQQQQVNSLGAQVERQKRLVRILSKRAKKGAVEKPDLIQVEALLAATQTRLSKARYDLSNIWDQLVISLQFPQTFLSVDPMDIPTSIDNPVPLSLRVCGQKEPIKTANIYALEKSLEGLDHDFRAAKNESLPDVKLVAGYRGNSIDQRAATTFNNVLNGRDENGVGLGPAWNVGVKMVWPLGNSGARAQRTEKYIQKEKTAAQLQMAVDELKTLWRDSCRKLKVEWDNEKVFENVVKQQIKRVKAEERRFRLGRIRVDQLVNAENDLGDWEFQSQQKKIQVRELAWKVQQYSGEMYRFLAPQIRELIEKGVQ